MIGVLGINYKTAPIEIREKFAFSDEEAIKFIKLLKIDSQVHGAIVLSTCNRTEIYYHTEQQDSENAKKFLIRNLEYFKEYSDDYAQNFYFKYNSDAIEHLFKVVSGIDSLIIGEDQIIGQVKSAFKLSLDNNLAGSVLTRMFNKSFEAGKRVRSETAINQGAASVSSAAVELCADKIEGLTKKNILLVGTGQTGELALQNFSKRGCKNLFITNRTYSKAQNIAQKYKGKAFELDQLAEFLPLADIVLVATSSKTHLITDEMVAAFNELKTNGQLYIDLSVPRNISQSIGMMEHVELYAVDDLQELVKATAEKRKDAIKDAMEIIESVKQDFSEWLCALELTPTIVKIKKNFHQINKSELQGFIKINSVKNPEIVEYYAEHITEKYARLFIKNLKMVTENGKRKEYVNLLNELFELSA